MQFKSGSADVQQYLRWLRVADKQSVSAVMIFKLETEILDGNLAWRVICETWILLFNIHALLASIDRGVKHNSSLGETDTQREVKHEKLPRETKSPGIQPEKSRYDVARPASVLGL